MKKITLNIKDTYSLVTEFTFICECKDTRTGFKHVVDLYINNIHSYTATCYYYNRTWETYQYQTCCIKAINQKIEHVISHEKPLYMHSHDYKRMTQKRQQDFLDWLKNNNTFYTDLINCKEKLLHNIY